MITHRTAPVGTIRYNFPLKSAYGDYFHRLLALAESDQLTAQVTPAGAIGDVGAGGDSFAAGIGGLATAPVVHAPSLAGGSDLQLLARPLDDYAPTLNPAHPSLGAAFADRTAQGIGDLVDAKPLEVAALGKPLRGYQTLYPEQFAALSASVGDRLARRIGDLVDVQPLRVAALGKPLRGYQALYPDQFATLSASVADRLARRIGALADSSPFPLAKVGAAIEEFTDLFPGRDGTLRDKIATRLESRIQRMVTAQPLDVASIETPISAYATLFASRAGALRADVGTKLAKRIEGLKLSTLDHLNVIGPHVKAYRTLFDDQYDALKGSLATRVATAIAKLKGKDIYAADKLRRAALKGLPDSEVIMQIRLELPLEELIEGEKLLARGKLTAADEMLAAAQEADPLHSGIPPFSKALNERRQKAQADYDKYVRYTRERKSRADRRTLLASARKLWSDNKAFVVAKEPRKGFCMRQLAGYGKAQRSTCYDLVSKRIKGPVMIVVPAGGEFAEPFAIRKFEITVNDFNRYCKATKKCKSFPSKTRTLPVTRLTLQQALDYAEWSRCSPPSKRVRRYAIGCRPRTNGCMPPTLRARHRPRRISTAA